MTGARMLKNYIVWDIKNRIKTAIPIVERKLK
jgi:hypothetical protein